MTYNTVGSPCVNIGVAHMHANLAMCHLGYIGIHMPHPAGDARVLMHVGIHAWLLGRVYLCIDCRYVSPVLLTHPHHALGCFACKSNNGELCW